MTPPKKEAEQLIGLALTSQELDLYALMIEFPEYPSVRAFLKLTNKSNHDKVLANIQAVVTAVFALRKAAAKLDYKTGEEEK